MREIVDEHACIDLLVDNTVFFAADASSFIAGQTLNVAGASSTVTKREQYAWTLAS